MWGVPDVITSDRGAQFVSELWIEMGKLMGIARNTTTSYHPQHNRKIERMHRCLKNSLRARLLGRPNWLAELTKLVGRVTVGNAGVTRSCQPGDRGVSITAGHRSATRFARPVGC